MREIAYAKVNLALHVRAREPDRYHRIETLFAFAEDGDVVEAEVADDLKLGISGPFAGALSSSLPRSGGEGDHAQHGGGAPERSAGELRSPPLHRPSHGPPPQASLGRNLVLRAAEALRERFGVRQGAALHLTKNLPVASGLGGGSADAAATLRLLTALWQLPATQDDLLAIASPLGADVPACVLSRTARGEGRGNALQPIDDPDLTGRPMLLVNPGVAVPTGPVFAGWDGVDRGPLARWQDGRNDLEPPARVLAPEIGVVLGALCEAPVARMSGSGATCFALYDSPSDRDDAAARIAEAQPGWWCLATRLK